MKVKKKGETKKEVQLADIEVGVRIYCLLMCV